MLLYHFDTEYQGKNIPSGKKYRKIVFKEAGRKSFFESSALAANQTLPGKTGFPPMIRSKYAKYRQITTALSLKN